MLISFYYIGDEVTNATSFLLSPKILKLPPPVGRTPHVGKRGNVSIKYQFPVVVVLVVVIAVVVIAVFITFSCNVQFRNPKYLIRQI
jgi:hypothetical protein